MASICAAGMPGPRSNTPRRRPSGVRSHTSSTGHTGAWCKALSSTLPKARRNDSSGKVAWQATCSAPGEKGKGEGKRTCTWHAAVEWSRASSCSSAPTSSGRAGSCDTPRARSSTLAMSWFMRSMSRSSRSTIDTLGWVFSNSSASRMRAKGVRRSCDTPASSRVRAANRSRTWVAMWLKRWLSWASSSGPSSGNKSGVSPWPMRAAACARRATGVSTRRASQAARPTATASPRAKATPTASKGWLLMRSAGRPTTRGWVPVDTCAQYQGPPSSPGARTRWWAWPRRWASDASSK